mgnify:CR=1 FL=1
MIAYICEWCGAKIIRDERAICISRHVIQRRPLRWTADEDAFSSGDHEVMFHEKCFFDHPTRILGFLYDGLNLEPPRQRSLNPPVWD